MWGEISVGRRLRGRHGTAAIAASLICCSAAQAIPAPSDPLYPQQVAAGGALAVMRHPQAMAAIGTTPLQEVLVTNLDTGVDLVHPDLASRLATVPAGTPAPTVYGQPPSDPATVPAGGSKGWDLIGFADQPQDGSVKPDADPTDPPGHTGHGTAVAGLMMQAWNNGVGGAGIAPNARLLPIRSCWDYDDCFGSVQADAVPWIAARGVRVVSMSWLSGPPGPDGHWGDGLDTAIAAASNTLFIGIPSGNGGAALAPDDRRPCGDPSPNVLCVSTSAPDDGLDCGEYSPTMVDFAVPTNNNITTLNGGATTTTGCATSFASPTAAGAATVLFGLDPSATPAQVKAALIDSARPAAAWQGRAVSGGVLDLDAAVRLFAQRRGITLASDPTPVIITEPDRPGGGGGGTDRTVPVLSGLSLGRTSFTRGRATTLRITLSEPAALVMSLKRGVKGRRSRGGTCVSPGRAPRRARSCTRYVRVPAVHLPSAPAGTSRVPFRGRRDDGKALSTGRYKATIVAVDAAGNRSAAGRLTFTITAP
jgi:hypothetical protein